MRKYVDIIKINNLMRDEHEIGKNHLVFADDADTEYLLMSKVADSFGEFISMIRVED